MHSRQNRQFASVVGRVRTEIQEKLRKRSVKEFKSSYRPSSIWVRGQRITFDISGYYMYWACHLVGTPPDVTPVPN